MVSKMHIYYICYINCNMSFMFRKMEIFKLTVRNINAWHTNSSIISIISIIQDFCYREKNG